jgi:hypothetical protein
MDQFFHKLLLDRRDSILLVLEKAFAAFDAQFSFLYLLSQQRIGTLLVIHSFQEIVANDAPNIKTAKIRNL